MLCLQAPAKINWTLDILGVRPDGYHLLEMLMQSVDLCDTLCLWEADELTLEGNAQSAAGQGEAMASQPVRFDERNLVFRAAQALLAHTGKRLGARMQLTKRIPSGAGLGGGSADAAAALVGLNALWKLNLSREALLDIGLRLGADVPFLLTGGLARVSGIGERMVSLSPAPEIWLVITQPCAGLSTAEVFAAYDAGGPLGLRPDNDAAQAALENGRRLFIAQGDADWQVTTADGIEAWKAALEGAQFPVEYHLYENLNHLLMTQEGSVTRTLMDYALPGHVSQQVIEDIAAFILAGE